MRRILLFLSFFILVPSLLTAAPKGKKQPWTPVLVSVYPDRFMLPHIRTVYGLELSFAKTGAKKVGGFQVATVWAESQKTAGFQIGTFRAQSDALDGFQIALFPLTLKKMRGLQLGLINNLKFDEEDERLRVCGLQVGAINAANRLEGFQLGLLNNGLRVRGGQVGVFNYSLNFRALQMGAFNLVGIDQDPKRVAKGLQVGLINLTTQEFHGLQIGVFNSVQRLSGVQIGVINYVHNPKPSQLLLFPLINVGW